MVNWERVCALKENGGLGIINLTTHNHALLIKWLWELEKKIEWPLGQHPKQAICHHINGAVGGLWSGLILLERTHITHAPLFLFGEHIRRINMAMFFVRVVYPCVGLEDNPT